MPNYLTDNLNQSVFLDINYLDVLGHNTFEYSLYKLLTETLDLAEFHQRYKNSNVGRKAYPPELLLRVIFYAYYRGVTSSRSIERLCKTDLKFMALAAGRQPHFTTIADFVSGHCAEMKTLFHKILMICCQCGLVGREHFAIDGCKLPSDASKAWSGSHSDLRKKSAKLRQSAERIIERHKANDSDKSKGDKERELKTIDTLIKSANKIDEFLGVSEMKMGTGRRPKEVKSNVTDNESTKMTCSKGTIQGFNCQAAADELYQIVVEAKAVGVGPDHSLLKEMVEGIKRNLSEDVFTSGALLTADTGYSSETNMEYLFEDGINAIVPDTNFRQRDPRFAESETYLEQKKNRQETRKDKRTRTATIPASEFKVNMDSKTCVCPAGKELLYLGDEFESPRGNYIRFRGRLNDCRRCALQTQCMKKPIKEQGRQVSFLINGKSKSSYLDLMKQKIDCEEGKKAYARRMWTIEPVFANITSNKGLNKITLRGEAKATAQWLMYCMVRNIEKMWRYG